MTRPAMHLPLVRLAAEKGIAVLCQKPMAETWSEALEIAAVARRAGVRLMMNENWRWQPWYRRIRELLTQGAIGRPSAKDADTAPNFQRDITTPPLFRLYQTMAPHSIRLPY